MDLTIGQISALIKDAADDSNAKPQGFRSSAAQIAKAKKRWASQQKED